MLKFSKHSDGFWEATGKSSRRYRITRQPDAKTGSPFFDATQGPFDSITEPSTTCTSRHLVLEAAIGWCLKQENGTADQLDIKKVAAGFDWVI